MFFEFFNPYYVVGGVVVLWGLLGFYTLRPQQSALLSFFGNPIGAKEKPGINWRAFGFVSVKKVSNAIQEFAFKEVVFTKQEVDVASSAATVTGDAPVIPTTKQTAMASVTVEGVVQFHVMTGKDNLVAARFKLSNPEQMIKQRFQNALRGKMNTMTMWDALSDKDTAASAIKIDLSHVTTEFGHEVDNISITNVTPDAAIVKSNNDMIASAADMQTRANKGKGEQFETVAIAKGRADAMIENGRGIAGQRDAVAKGMKAAVAELKGAVPGAKPEDLMAMVLYTIHTDMMRSLADKGATKIIFADNSPTGPADVLRSLRSTLVGANGASEPVGTPPADAHPQS
jgi:regulator of protease activity HflC (stomatin/prohibitin superfamily)